MLNLRSSIFAFAISIALFSNASAWAEKKIPALTGPVIDESYVLSPSDIKELDQQIRSYMPTVQMQVWITPSLDGDSIEGLSIRAVEKWKVGDEKKDNGLLLIVAVQDRRMRIEVGQGLEGNIPDLLAGRIVDYILRPAFRKQAYAEGIHAALLELYRAAGGQAVDIPVSEERVKEKSLSPSELLVLVIFVIIFGSIFLPLAFFSGFNRRNRGGFWTSGGWGGGGGGFGGGGWSGGGGGFSGGGSSGSW